MRQKAENADDLTSPMLTILLESLEDYWKNYMDKLPDRHDGDDMEDAIAETEMDYLECKLVFQARLKRMQPISDNNDNNIAQRNPNPIRNRIALPPIQIAKFGGNYGDWLAFNDIFSKLVINDGNLSGAEKLYYLKSSLEGDAEQLIRSYQVTDANFQEAWNALKGRYENKRLIVTALLNSLFTQAQLKSESATALRNQLDAFSESLGQLTQLGLPTQHWDAILVHMFTQKLDTTSRRNWELSLIDNELPTFQRLRNFLETQARSLEATQAAIQPTKSSSKQRSTRTHLTTDSTVCPICKETHFVYSCPKFIALEPGQRYKLAVQHRLCFNCLRSDHSTRSCRSGNCRKCDRQHHTLLHYLEKTNNELPSKPAENNVVSHFGATNNQNAGKYILLATALAAAKASDGTMTSVRLLIDSGSQSSFITEACAQRLRLARTKINLSIIGLASAPAARTRGLVNVQLHSLQENKRNIWLDALILDRITSRIPDTQISRDGIEKMANCPLADPWFNDPAEIDILIGADAHGRILLDGVIHCTKNGPTAQNTILGWVLSGPIAPINSSLKLHSLMTIRDNWTLVNSLQHFWEIENFGSTNVPTLEENICEKHFLETHRRAADGRYIVKMPFNEIKTPLGDSFGNALKSFEHLERRFAKSPKLKAEYVKFIDKYISLGHMSLAINADKNDNAFYLPHHPVFKGSGDGRKIRVVFDASRKTTTGVSLNDKHIIGPKLQDDLMDILIRFRSHKVAFTCDIVKMYRQILMDETHRNYQRIIWRENPTAPLQHFVLNTVTYGTSSASFLAIRALKQLALDEADKYPLASKVTLMDFYVDDLMSGCDTVLDALKVKSELIKMLNCGGMTLSKWASNHATLLEPNSSGENAVSLDHDDAEEPIKTLGLFWFPASDVFGYQVHEPSNNNITKRSILSDICKIFDPLGLLAPVIITAKIFMQTLWAAGIGWDDNLPDTLATIWHKYRLNLQQVDKIKINRFLETTQNGPSQLHGFCDASEAAYGAVVYVLTQNSDGRATTNIIAAKTKVAPVRKVSLPRLELCGALLLARLLERVKGALKLDNTIPVTAWTDSTVVLAWLRQPSRNWQTFVANRVAEIQTTIGPENWRHVPGIENPADCSSRGISAESLREFDLWWIGPGWLRSKDIFWPKSSTKFSTKLDQKTAVISLITTKPDETLEILNRFSTINRLKRTTAYIWRFIYNCKNKSDRKTGRLTVSDLHNALLFWLKVVQQQEFSDEIIKCKNDVAVSKNSCLKSLNPIIDSDGLLRVGGRLAASTILDYDEKHQYILPRHGKLTELLILDSHLRNLHGGAQMTLCHLRQNFWIIGSRSVVRNQINKCIICIRHAKEPAKQQMAHLPANRVQPGRPFSTSSVDYAGPLTIRLYKGRCKRFSKAYIAVFICFATKAIHLEAVSDLTTDAFLAAFRRFVARRGTCANLHSDCGKNFVGADRELQNLLKQLGEQHRKSSMADALANLGTNWHFIPPGSPSFGGIWEAGVKQAKHHLRRVLGNNIVTFEELATILTQIEACLNSRPLCALTNDPTDLSALTPGHFLIGDQLNCVPDPDLTSIACSRLSRWQLMQQMVQHFWTRWQGEYLASLQQRNKWMFQNQNIAVGTLALIIDERVPPTKCG